VARRYCCRYSRCAAWRAALPFIELVSARLSKAFLEAHEHAFGYFGGVFRVLRYDNLKAAVKKIRRGFRREETARFIAFRSHWRFASEFCTPEEPH
jgi:transposase